MELCSECLFIRIVCYLLLSYVRNILGTIFFLMRSCFSLQKSLFGCGGGGGSFIVGVKNGGEGGRSTFSLSCFSTQKMRSCVTRLTAVFCVRVSSPAFDLDQQMSLSNHT